MRLRNKIWLLCVGSLTSGLCLGFILFSNPHPAKCQGEQADCHYHYGNSPGTARTAQGSLIGQTVKGASHDESGNGKSEKSKDTTDTLLVIFNALLAIFTLGLWISTNKLWAAGEKQIGISERNAAAATTSAQAAQEIILTTRDNARLELRAYVWVEVRNITSLDVVNPIAVRVAMSNAGRTPAYNVRLSCGAFIGPRNIPSGTQFNASFAGAITITTIHHGNDRKFGTARTSTPPSSAEISNIANGSQHRLYVAGKVTYDDAFGIGHTTKFLVSTGGVQFQKAFADASALGRNLPDGADVDWEHNNLHNEAD